MKVSTYFIPFDTFERNKKIAGLLKKNQSVLDIGGGAVGLKLFSDNPVTSLDPEGGDIKKDARHARIADGSFDIVTCVDVLEHIPQKDRPAFVKRVEKMARKKIIFSAPYGSREHLSAERRLIEALSRKGKKIDFLQQHVKNGLPKPEAVTENTQSKNFKVFYSGNYKISNFLFLIHLYEVGFGPIDRFLLLLKKCLNLFLNTLVYKYWFYEAERPTANRFYVVIKK